MVQAIANPPSRCCGFFCCHKFRKLRQSRAFCSHDLTQWISMKLGFPHSPSKRPRNALEKRSALAGLLGDKPGKEAASRLLLRFAEGKSTEDAG